MFETTRVPRPVILRGLLASSIIHGLALFVFWEARTFPVRFSAVQIVYAAPEHQPLWFPTPPFEAAQPPAVIPAASDSPFRSPESVPSPSPESGPVASIEDMSPSDGAPVPPQDGLLLKASFVPESSAPEPVHGRLEDLPHLPEGSHPLDVDAPRLPDAPEPKAAKAPVRQLVVQQAQLIKKTVPVYPRLARTARVEGRVVLQADISETGLLENIIVVEGHPMLAPAAVEALRDWRYSPAKLNGVPSRSSVTITVNFRLEYQ